MVENSLMFDSPWVSSAGPRIAESKVSVPRRTRSPRGSCETASEASAGRRTPGRQEGKKRPGVASVCSGVDPCAATIVHHESSQPYGPASKDARSDLLPPLRGAQRLAVG